MTDKKQTAAQKKAAAKKVRVAKMKQAREAKELTMKAKLTAAHQKLAPVAKEINVRMEKASKALDQADDHRLAAAIRLNEAKTMCSKVGIKFTSWCDDNVVSQSKRTIRQLVQIGGEKDPAQALADMRKDNAEANKKARAKAKTERVKAPVEVKETKTSPLQRATDMFGSLDDTEAGHIMTKLVADRGMVMVSQDDAKAAREARDGVKLRPDFKSVMTLFDSCPGSIQMQIVQAVCKATGTEITNEFTEASPTADDDDLTDIPDFLAAEHAFKPEGKLTVASTPAAAKKSRRKDAA